MRVWGNKFRNQFWDGENKWETVATILSEDQMSGNIEKQFSQLWGAGGKVATIIWDGQMTKKRKRKGVPVGKKKSGNGHPLFGRACFVPVDPIWTDKVSKSDRVQKGGTMFDNPHLLSFSFFLSVFSLSVFACADKRQQLPRRSLRSILR